MMLYSHEHYTYIYTCRNITTQWRRATQFFRKIYLSLFLKGLCVTEQNCNILTPTLMAITAFLSHSPGLLNSGTCSSFQHLLSSWSKLQMVWTSCCRGYIIIWRPLFFLRASQFLTQFNPSTVKVVSWYSSTRCSYYLHSCISYFDSLAGSEVNM